MILRTQFLCCKASDSVFWLLKLGKEQPYFNS